MAKIIKQIKFGKLKIGENEPAVIIAEIADSHNGSIKTAKKLVEEAKQAGADIAKFQLHLPDVEMVPDSIQMWDGPLYNILKRNLFTPKMHKEIMNYCEKLGIEYLCTPFCPAAVDVLNKLGVKAFKTGSGELTNLPMQRKLAKISAKTGKPMIISTGMSTWKEIAETVKIHKDEGSNFMLMNCTSEYPPKYEHINLGLIPKMREEFGVLTGQSDHTMDNYTAYAAIALGAKAVEKHFTLSRKQKGPDHFISLEPPMLKDLVSGIRKIEAALENGKIISKEEHVVRDWAFHSVVADRNIKAGEKITLDNVRPARPGRGIPAKYLDPLYSGKIIGKTVKRNLPKSAILQWSDLA